MSKYENYRTDFTVEDISGFLSVSKETVRRWIRNGDLVTLNTCVGGRGEYVIAKSDFLGFLRNHEKYRNTFYRGKHDNRFSKYKILDTTNRTYWKNVPSEKTYAFPNKTRASVFEHEDKSSVVVALLNDEEVENLLETILKIDERRKED